MDGLALTMKSGVAQKRMPRTRAHPAGAPAGHRPTRGFCHCALLPKGRPHCPPQAGFPPTLSAGAAPRHSLRPGSEGDARDPPRVHTSPAAEASPARIPQRRARAAAGSGRGPLPLKGPGSLSYPCPPLDVTTECLGGGGARGHGRRFSDPSAPDPITPSFFHASANLPPAVPSSATPPPQQKDGSASSALC